MAAVPSISSHEVSLSVGASRDNGSHEQRDLLLNVPAKTAPAFEQPRLTALVRIAILALAVSAGLGFQGYVIGTAPRLHPLPGEECFQHAQGPMPAHCSNSLYDMPRVVFDVSWPAFPGPGGKFKIRCNELETPGGDCYALVSKFAPLIAWGSQFGEPGSVSQVYSSSSTLIREMGYETGTFGREVLRALTLGAFSSKALLGVKFNLDNHALAAGAYRQDWVAALAKTVLRNANLPTEVVHFAGMDGCTREGYARGSCRAPVCGHLYSAGSADENRFGLAQWEERPAPSGGLCGNASMSAEEIWRGARPIREECALEAGAYPWAYLLYGYELECAVNPNSIAESPLKLLCFIYLLLTCLLGVFVSAVLNWLLSRHSAALEEDTRREILAAFPALRRVAEAEGRDVQDVVRCTATLMIVIEVSLDGELSSCFVHPSKGAVGASLHALVVVAIATPVHTVSYFMASSLALPTAYLVYHYSVFGGYLVAYYLRALPLRSRRAMLAARALMRTSFVVFFMLTTVQLVWLVAALAYNQQYVINLFLIATSALGYAYAAASARSRLSALQRSQMQASSQADALQMSLASKALSKLAGTPAGVDPIAHLLDTQLRPALTPHLSALGLDWHAALPVLETVDSLEELGMAVVNPIAFLHRLESVPSAAATRWLHARLRVLIVPLLAEHTMQWDDVRPSVELIDSLDELKSAIADPKAFVASLVATTATSFAKRWLVNQLKAAIEPHLAKVGVAWEKTVRVIELIDTVEEVKEALADPEAFLIKVKAIADPEGSADAAAMAAIDAAETAASVVKAVGTAVKVGTRAAAAMRKMHMTNREILRIFAVGGVLLALAAIFTLMGSYLFNEGPAGFSITNLAMPFSVLVTKVVSDKKIAAANETDSGDGGAGTSSPADDGVYEARATSSTWWAGADGDGTMRSHMTTRGRPLHVCEA